jgi:hypothetical protein
MAKQTIDLGTLGGADGTGDSIRTAGAKINNNFTELYATSAVQSHIGIVQNNISSTLSNADIVLKPAGTGSISFPALRFNDNSIEGSRSNDSLRVLPSGTGSVKIDSINIKETTISTNTSNSDIELSASGSGSVLFLGGMLVDDNMQIKDNVIKTTASNSDLIVSPAGTGSVQITNIDLNEGTVDNTVIGASTPAAGSFTTITSDSINTTGLSITDNRIRATQSNDDLEVNGRAAGVVVINGLSLFNQDGEVGEVLKTDGNGTLFFASHSSLFDNSFLEDVTATVLGSSSAPQVVDTWSASSYRSVKYHIQISDATADRYRLIDANVTHDGVTAYISVFGGVDNGDGDGSSVYDTIEFSADISGGNVRLLGTVNNTNDQAIKLIRRVINV